MGRSKAGKAAYNERKAKVAKGEPVPKKPKEAEPTFTAEQRLFIATYPYTLNLKQTAEKLGFAYDTVRDWNSRAKWPHVREAVEAAIAARFDDIKAQMEIRFRENWDFIYDGIKDVYEEARLEKDHKNALRALEKLAKISGLDVNRTELSGPSGDPIVIQSSTPDDEDAPQFEGWPEDKVLKYISLRREANLLAKNMAASADQGS